MKIALNDPKPIFGRYPIRASTYKRPVQCSPVIMLGVLLLVVAEDWDL